MISGDTLAAQGKDGAFYQMLRRFSQHWNRIDILCPPVSGQVVDVLHQNVYFHSASGTKLQMPLFIRRRGQELLGQRHYNLLTSHDYGLFLNGLGAYWLTRANPIPWVSEIHHVEGYPIAATYRERLYRIFARQYIRRIAPRVAAFRVVNSVEIPELFRSLGVPDEKILILPSLYLNFDIFRPLPEEQKQFDLVFVGRLASNKGIFQILDALAQVREKYPTIRLAILGQGALRTAIETRIERDNLASNVTLPGRLNSTEDIARLYNQSKMLICASTSEGGPRVTVEAMACGVPVISTPVGIMKELLRDGVNGLVFQWNTDELARKICLLLENEALRKQLGESGRQSVQHFRAETVIDQYAQGYHDLIRRKG